MVQMVDCLLSQALSSTPVPLWRKKRRKKKEEEEEEEEGRGGEEDVTKTEILIPAPTLPLCLV
jgi:hypothetical protein